MFSRRCGTPGAPALVLVHGFPTSSIDYFALAGELGSEFDIYLLDFPGYGLSDKPPEPYVYSLYDDARLLVYAITQVWKLTEYRMLTHDRGSSVGMIALGMLAALDPPTVPVDLIVTNANIYLPLSNLTAFQTALLDPATGRATAAAMTPEMLAAGLGASTFMPRRTLDDPEIAALAKCFAHNDGIRVLPDTIQYLHERAADETSWLEALSKSHGQHHGGVGPARQRRAAARPQPCLADVSEEQARPQPLLGGARRRPLPAVRRPRAIGPDRSTDGPGRGHSAADARQSTRRRGLVDQSAS